MEISKEEFEALSKRVEALEKDVALLKKGVDAEFTMTIGDDGLAELTDSAGSTE